jgi:GNAT superfamily N-acetyltransferase
MSPLAIEPFQPQHLDAAVGLFVAGYEELRRTVPMLPERYACPSVVRPLLEAQVARDPFVVAIEEGAVAGYLGGMRVPQLKGRDKGVYCPEWAHAVTPTAEAARRRRIYDALYEAIGETWVGEGRLNHAITLLAHDTTARDTWFWNGFGMLVVDVVRGTDPLACAPVDGGVRVRLATPADLPALLPVAAEHAAYYRRAPIFLPISLVTNAAELESFLADPARDVCVAEEEGRVLGFMQIRVGSEDACTIVRDEDTASCVGAYVRPDARRAGLGTRLLAASLTWTQERGCRRFSLDFEAANLYGRRFWLKHLTPVCHSLLRHVNDGMLEAPHG